MSKINDEIAETRKLIQDLATDIDNIVVEKPQLVYRNAWSMYKRYTDIAARSNITTDMVPALEAIETRLIVYLSSNVTRLVIAFDDTSHDLDKLTPEQWHAYRVLPKQTQYDEQIWKTYGMEAYYLGKIPQNVVRKIDPDHEISKRRVQIELQRMKLDASIVVIDQMFKQLKLRFYDSIDAESVVRHKELPEVDLLNIHQSDISVVAPEVASRSRSSSVLFNNPTTANFVNLDMVFRYPDTISFAFNDTFVEYKQTEGVDLTLREGRNIIEIVVFKPVVCRYSIEITRQTATPVALVAVSIPKLAATQPVPLPFASTTDVLVAMDFIHFMTYS